jgi:hypothetical protein
MLLREIGQFFGKLSWLRRIGAAKDVPERSQILECHAACSNERRNGSERRVEVRHRANGHGTASSATMRQKTDKPARAGASIGKNISPGDIARSIFGTNSGAAISKVLVVGTDGSAPVTRMEIHFADLERVPAAFSSLASALHSTGFEFKTVTNCNVPPSEIWLSYPLNDQETTLLACAAQVEEQQIARVAVQAGLARGQTSKHASINARHELIWEARNSRERGKENRERTS